MRATSPFLPTRPPVRAPALSRPRLRRGAGLLATVVPLLLALAGLLLPASRARAEEPVGPRFGTNRYRTEIRGRLVPDEDDYVEAVASGERLSVSVTADAGSELRPELVLLDPGGADRTPPVRVSRSGRSASFRGFRTDRTGRWTVRVRGAGGTEGAYAVAFRLVPAPRLRARGQEVGAPGTGVRPHPFEAVEGSVLRARVRHPRGASLTLGVADPDGDAEELSPADGLRATKTSLVVARTLPATGSYVLGVAAGPGAQPGRYSLDLVVAPPPRPRGTTVLSPREPHMLAAAEPLEGTSSQLVRMDGSGFSVSPRPRVLFAGREGTVAAVAANGVWLQAAPPLGEEGRLVAVTVVNPDGQADRREGHFRYAAAAGAVARLAPAFVTLRPKAVHEFTLTLSGPAPAAGAEIELSVLGGVGAVPATLHVPAHATHAAFDLVASESESVGAIRATWGGTVEASVTVAVEPPPPPPPPADATVDLSGWTLTQTDSFRVLSLPSGTVLSKGGYLVLGRNATQAAFEAFWGVELGPDVVYLNGGDVWPSINGQEAYTLRNASGVLVDGPTIQLVPATVYQRKAGGPAGLPESWVAGAAAPGVATPGSGQPPPATPTGVYVSELSDAVGAGTFVYEFVEVHYDGTPP